MNRRLFGISALLLAGGLLGVEGFHYRAAASGPTVTWQGYITDTWCGVNRDTKAPTVECTQECIRDKNAQYAFYNLSDQKVYVLKPQKDIVKYAGELVNITGTVGDAVRFATMRGPREGNILTPVSVSPVQTR